jgi:hypothetical protein
LFQAGTGWLGWSPEVTLNTPIPQILLAIDGKFEFVARTNPFGGRPKPKGKPKEGKPVKTAESEIAAFTMTKLAARQKHLEKAAQNGGIDRTATCQDRRNDGATPS